MGYATKSAWAAAKAEGLRKQAAETRAQHVPSSQWQRVRRKVTAVRTLEDEARRFDQLADRFRARGV